MLTYREFKEAEALALETSRRQQGAPMAIFHNNDPAWWDFKRKPWRVGLMTPDTKTADVIVGPIIAMPKF